MSVLLTYDYKLSCNNLYALDLMAKEREENFIFKDNKALKCCFLFVPNVDKDEVKNKQ